MPFRLPFRRKREPSAPPPPPQPPPERSEQMQSPFFSKLPLEVRLQIYEHALALGGSAVVEEWQRPVRRRRGDEMIMRAPGAVRPLSLLQSCERVYAEARPVLYQCTTLRIYGFTMLRVPTRAWSAWVRSVHFSWRLNDPVGAVRRQKRGCVHGIRYVANHTWTDAWAALAALPSLTWLRVDLELHPNAMLAFMARESDLLAPLKAIVLRPPSATAQLFLNWPREVPLPQSAEGMLPHWKVERDLDWYNAYIKKRRGW